MDIRDRLRQVEAQAQRLAAPGWGESPRIAVPAAGLATGVWMFATVQGRTFIAFMVIAVFIAVALTAAFSRRPAVRASVKQDVKPDSSLDWRYLVGFMAVMFILSAMTDFAPDPGIGIAAVIAAIAGVVAMVWFWLVLDRSAPEPVTPLTESQAAPADAGLTPEELEICAALIAAGATEGEVRRELRASTLHSLIDANPDLTNLSDRNFVAVFRERGSKEDTDWVTLTRAGESAARGQWAATGTA